MKKFFKDFKNFIAKGNVVDMAVGVIIGGAFGKIVSSLVNDIIMPLISLVAGGVSVADWKWVITEAVYENGVLITAETALHYGNFLQTIIDFLIIALCIFMMLKAIMSAKDNLHRESVLSKEEIKALKAQGKSRKEIAAAEEQKKAEIEAAKAAEEPAETVESLLKDIKQLLSKQDKQ